MLHHFTTGEPFTKEDLAAVTTWNESSLDTYWSKQLRPFVIQFKSGKYRVSEAFRPFARWERFREHVSQVRRVTANDYKHSEFESVLVFEFFMPLTNEGPLRNTLDALFFKDTVLSKLRSVDEAELEEHFPRENGEGQEAYLDRLCGWISDTFVGYSISHVSGRFRMERLATHTDAARSARYLADETTAVTRFIFPCSDDPERIRWFFHRLFVDSITQVVNGEDEIWMVESGMRNCLHIWRIVEES